MFQFAAILYFGLLGFLPLFFWRSKRNLIFILPLPLLFIAYFFGSGFFLKKVLANGVRPDTVDFYSLMLILSTLITVLSFFIGFHSKKNGVAISIQILVSKITPNYHKLCASYVNNLIIITELLFIFSYCGMGFVPAFAENPQAAKFFASEYQDVYKAFAIPFRLALLFSQITIPIILIKLYKEFRVSSLFHLVLIFILLLFSLRRGFIASQLLTFLVSYFIFKKKYLFWPMLILYFIMFIIGSSSLEFFLYLAGKIDKIDVGSIVRGVPDIQDQLMFIDSWLHDHWGPTYGLSVVGGLIPYHFKYNIGALSKIVVGGDDNVASGGFRLPVPLLGYISFGWYGVVLFSVVHGYFLGIFLNLTKYSLSRIQSLEEFIIVSFIWNLIYGLVMFPLNMQIDFLAFFLFTCILFRLTKVNFVFTPSFQKNSN